MIFMHAYSFSLMCLLSVRYLKLSDLSVLLSFRIVFFISSVINNIYYLHQTVFGPRNIANMQNNFFCLNGLYVWVRLSICFFFLVLLIQWEWNKDPLEHRHCRSSCWEGVDCLVLAANCPKAGTVLVKKTLSKIGKI